MNKNTKTNTNTKTQEKTLHIPVLLEEVLSALDPKQGESYLDLTAGYGGHAGAILSRTQAASKATLVDRDQMAVDTLTHRFADDGVTVLHQDFYTASETLVASGAQFDIILADLGISSPHIDIASRGFAIQQDGPLDMRMDQSQPISASTIVNTYSEDEIMRILRQYGEEPRAASIARNIIASRPLVSTSQLADLVKRAYPGHSKTHPATRTFQALRIAVNDELHLLERSLPLWTTLLAPGGRLGVISFHSLEDRIVKQFFAEHAGDMYDALLRPITKRPLVAREHELVLNPRARSAKLRAVAK